MKMDDTSWIYSMLIVSKLKVPAYRVQEVLFTLLHGVCYSKIVKTSWSPSMFFVRRKQIIFFRKWPLRYTWPN